MLTVSGTIFVWGRNEWGQLGIGATQEPFVPFPSLLKAIRGQQVCDFQLGEEHSVCVTLEGGVFSWGNGAQGQLGHGNAGNGNSPRKIFELMGEKVERIAVGRRHTVCCTDKGIIFSFGMNIHGQLGKPTDGKLLAPEKIDFLADWSNCVCLAAGGDQTFVASSRVDWKFLRGKQPSRTNF